MTLPAERFAFSYADGAHNAESLILDGASGTVYVVTKEVAGGPEPFTGWSASRPAQ